MKHCVRRWRCTRGDLLEGVTTSGWLPERDRLRQRYLDALDELAHLHQARGEPALAIAVAQRLLEGAPLREQAYRLLMRAHAARATARALRGLPRLLLHARARAGGAARSGDPRGVCGPAAGGAECGGGRGTGGSRAAGRPGRRAARLTAAWRSAELGRARTRPGQR